MNVLSLFDGLGGARIALDRMGIECNYYASEVDKYAIKVSSANYPDIIHLGDVCNIKASDLPKIDLLIGGSPCQDLSVAKSNREGLKGEKSRLFYEYLRLLEELKPKHFVLENVFSMGKENRDIITKLLGYSPVMINSALLTAQNRKRYYWTNFLVMPPQDKGILLKDIIEEGFIDRLKAYCLTATYKMDGLKHYLKKKQRQLVFRDKSGTIPATIYKENAKSMVKRNKIGLLVYTKEGVRKLTPVECERLQGIPDNYTNHVSNTQRYKMIGNGFTIPVIEHILSFAIK